MIPPGSTIGIIGGGQLGRMLSIAAAQLGYKTHIYDPHEQNCADDVAAYMTRAAFESAEAIERFGDSVDVATYEFENLPAKPLKALGDKLKPGIRSLAIAQDRATEKEFIEQCSARVAPWRSVASLEEVQAAVADLRLPLFSRPGAMDMTARARPGSARPMTRQPPGPRSARSPRSPKPESPSSPNSP